MALAYTGPDHAETAYALWLGDARRDVSEVARRLGVPRTTAQSWCDRYRWRERAATDDRQLAESMAGLAWRTVFELMPDTLLAWRGAVNGTGYTDSHGTAHPRPDPEQRKVLERNLGFIGVVVTKRLAVQVDAAPSLPIDDATIDALIASGDVAALRALGRGEAPLAGAVPPDFASDQPGGRGVPEAPRPDTIDADFRDVADD